MAKLAGLLFLSILLVACRSSHKRAEGSIVFLIESSPANLDPRIGTDAQSEHLQELLFDGLVIRDASYRFAPGLAERWEQPDPLTLVFHLRPNVHFADGRTLTSRDVLWTLNSMRNGTVKTAKAASYISVASIDAPDPRTVILRLKTADNFLLGNLSTGAMGIVPEGSGANFWQHPIGSGPFRFVSQEVDKEVVIDRNPSSWQPEPGQGSVQRIRFAVVPDPTTRALELEKGSADVASNALPSDTLPVLAGRKNILVESSEGTVLQYLGFNTRDPILRDVRVRQAIACAIDSKLIMKTLLGAHAQPASSLLPVEHWAYWANSIPPSAMPHYAYDPARATELLEQAGYHAGPGGVRLHLAITTSTDDEIRLLAAVLQQQLGHIGIAIELQSFEFGTFYQNVTRGAFQMYLLRWVGGNEQPDIFGYAFGTARIPPKGANRGRYSNQELDALLQDASQSSDQAKRQREYGQIQQILARDVPALNLWYKDSVVVHSRRLTQISISPSGSFDFLRVAKVQQQ
jgi:peptide/nickel transport system substrate-binding protein